MCNGFCESAGRDIPAVQSRGVVVRVDNELLRPRFGSGTLHDIRTADQPVEPVASIDDPEETRASAHDREVTDERTVVFVGVDGGEVEEPLVESLGVVPLDLYRMVKYWLYNVVDRFGDKAEVQSRRFPARGLLYDGDDRFGG